MIDFSGNLRFFSEYKDNNFSWYEKINRLALDQLEENEEDYQSDLD